MKKDISAVRDIIVAVEKSLSGEITGNMRAITITNDADEVLLMYTMTGNIRMTRKGTLILL